MISTTVPFIVTIGTNFFQSALHFAVEESGNHKRIVAHPVSCNLSVESLMPTAKTCDPYRAAIV